MINSCLIIYKDYQYSANTINDHSKSFSKFGFCFYKNLEFESLKHFPRKDLNLFDAIIIHYSIYLPDFLLKENKISLENLRSFQGEKFLFIQDEYRHINLTIEICLKMKISTLYSVCNKEASKKIYKKLLKNGIKVKNTLTGYINSEENQNYYDYDKRDLYISYRARNLSEKYGWLGRKAHEKAKIAKVKKYLEKYNLNIDISTKEEDRVYGENWNNLLKRSKATLITISGASVCDFTGNIQKDYENAFNIGKGKNFLRKIYEPYDGKIEATMLSQRVFEAALNKVFMIGYLDHYSEIIKPNIHYCVLKRDHSNLDEVICILKNKNYVTNFVNRVFKDLILSEKYTWRSFVNQFEVSENFLKTKKGIVQRLFIFFKNSFINFRFFINVNKPIITEKVKVILIFLLHRKIIKYLKKINNTFLI